MRVIVSLTPNGTCEPQTIFDVTTEHDVIDVRHPYEPPFNPEFITSTVESGYRFTVSIPRRYRINSITRHDNTQMVFLHQANRYDS